MKTETLIVVLAFAAVAFYFWQRQQKQQAGIKAAGLARYGVADFNAYQDAGY